MKVTVTVKPVRRLLRVCDEASANTNPTAEFLIPLANGITTKALVRHCSLNFI